MENCLVTKLKGTSSGGGGGKVGGLNLRITPNADQDAHYAYIYTWSEKSQDISLSDGAYFCTSLTDSTPVNTTKAASREAHLVTSTRTTLFVYFDDEEAYLTIQDKYILHGIGINSAQGGKRKWYVKYDLDRIKYLTKWEAFTAPINMVIDTPQELPMKKIFSSEYHLTGNLNGFTIGDASVTQPINLRDVSGAITLNIIASASITIYGHDCTCSVSDISAQATTLYLESNGISGDIGTWTKVPLYCRLGADNNRCSVTCTTVPTVTAKATNLEIYSNSINKAGFTNLVTNQLATTLLRVNSTSLDVAELVADTDIMDLVAAIKQAGCSVWVNGTKISDNV